VSWTRSLPTTIRYFTTGWPAATEQAEVFLSTTGPGAVAVVAGQQVAGGVRTVPLAEGIDAVLDAEAARLLP